MWGWEFCLHILLEDSQPHFSLWLKLLHFTRWVKPTTESQALPEPQLLTFCDAPGVPFWACLPCAAFVQVMSPWRLYLCPGNRDMHCRSWALHSRSLKRGHHITADFFRGFLIPWKNAMYPTHQGFSMLTTGENHGKNSLKTKGKARTNESYFRRQTKWSYVFSNLNTHL